ncbi:MAG: 5-(carboxyamino)imidazole ribonucleotide synthase [Gemmataceae bacterium]
MIGVLGGGQLGRMLALAGYPLGQNFRFFEPAADSCVESLAEVCHEEYHDETALARFAEGLELVTYEFESVPVQAARFLAERVPVYPPPEALEAAQDRLHEKRKFRALGVPCAGFAPVDSLEQLQRAAAELGLPAVLKTRRLGYDGKGQTVLRESEDLLPAWRQLGNVPLILESFVPFEREVSILAVRSRDGDTAFYPLVENVHRDGILRQSRVLDPAGRLQEQAEEYAGKLLEDLDYVGLLAIEFFVEKRSQGPFLLANEMAPRVHNSGHWSIEGAETSQFENHLRAILGLPLGSTRRRGPVALLNLIGQLPEMATLLAQPGVHLHLYGKLPRPGRKVGHVTLLADSEAELDQRLQLALTEIPDSARELSTTG